MSIDLMRTVYEKDVEASMQRVLLVLADHANDDGQCWPSIGKIAWKLNISERTIMRALKSLEERGVVTVERRQGYASVYTLHLSALPDKTPWEPRTSRVRGDKTSGVTPSDDGQNVTPTPDIAVSPLPGQNVTPTPDIAVSPEPPEEPTENHQKEPPPDDAPSGAGEGTVDPVEESFARFWSAYPRRTKKPAARDAWHKLSPRPELVETILAAVADQRQSDQWTRDNGRYIPHPATWINGQRWTDELAPALSSLPKNARTHSGEQADWFGEYADERGAA